MPNTVTEYIPDYTGGYIDPSAVIDPSTSYEDIVIGGSTVMIETVNLDNIKIASQDSSAWMHDNPTSAKIDLESVAYQVSNDLIFPDIKVTVADLSTGQYVDHNLR